MCLRSPNQLSKGPWQLFYRSSCTYLQDLSHFAIGLQPFLYRASTTYLANTNNLSTGTPPTLYSTQPIGYRTPANSLRIPNHLLLDLNKSARGHQQLFYMTLSEFLHDHNNLSTGPQPIYYGTAAMFLQHSNHYLFTRL